VDEEGIVGLAFVLQLIVVVEVVEVVVVVGIE
jgi:hypothetical protein